MTIYSTGILMSEFKQTNNDAQLMAEAFMLEELSGNCDPQLLGILCFIYEHISDRLLIEEMAASLRVSRRTLYRQILQSSDLTPTQMVRLARLRYAQHLLCSTALKITDVALAAGYSGSSQFCKHFQRHEGTSPREYRRNQQSQIENDLP